MTKPESLYLDSTNSITLDDLLKHQDREFVESLYVVLLRRQPDASGLEYYVQRIRKGISKIHIMRQVLSSPEAQAHGERLAILRRVVEQLYLAEMPPLNRLMHLLSRKADNTPRQTISRAPVQIADLEKYSDVDFIENLYQQVLHRPADPSGRAYYLKQLRDGDAKALIVHRVANSPEGRKVRQPIVGLQAQRLFAVLQSLPLLGLLWFLVNARHYMRRIRQLENNGGWAQHTLAGDQANQFEQQVPAFVNTMSSLHVFMREAQRRLSTLEQSGGTGGADVLQRLVALEASTTGKFAQIDPMLTLANNLVQSVPATLRVMARQRDTAASAANPSRSPLKSMLDALPDADVLRLQARNALSLAASPRSTMMSLFNHGTENPLAATNIAQTLRNLRSRKQASTSSRPVSIVINTYNRANLLPNTLNSFCHLDYPNFEVIVVNGPSTDGTQAVLDAWKGKIRVGSCPEANLSMSRNIGIAMAQGEFVAFIDDDALPEPEWLDQAIAAFDNDEVGASGGKVFDHTGYQYQYQYANANRLGNGKWQLTAASPDFCFPLSFEFPYLQGTNTIFRRSALLEIGGFDEEFIYYLDETDVCLRLIDAGYVVRQLPNAYVHHKYAPSHIRNKGVAKYRFPVLKSKIYFSNRYAPLYMNTVDIDNDNLTFIQNHRNDVELHLRAGNLTQTDLDNFEQHVQTAWAQAKEAVLKPRRLLTSAQLDRLHGKFRPFPAMYNEEALVIVMMCEDYPPISLGGIARFTQDKATALAALGHKVHVIARSHSYNTVDFESGVWVHRITADAQPLSAEAAELRVPQSHWDQSKSFLNEIDRIATHRRIDVVEAPIWNIVGIAPLLSRRYKVVTSLMTTLKLSLPSRPDITNDPHIYENFAKPLIDMEAYMVKHSHKVLAISQGIAREIENAYDLTIAADRLFVSPLGMPDWAAETAACKPWSNKPANELWILFVGRLETRKGIDVLLNVLPKLAGKFPNIKLHVVGDDTIPAAAGKTYRGIFEQSHPQLVNTKVIFHGKLPDADLRAAYAACDVFVAPSRFESFGLIYVEAMMYAKPVVGCRAGGIPEVIADRKTGLLAEPGDAATLHAVLDELVRDAALRKSLGRQARKRYEEMFTDKAMALSCLQMYAPLARESV